LTVAPRPSRHRTPSASFAGLVLIGLAAASWGTTGSVSTVLASRAHVEPLVVGLARMWLAAALLVAGARIVSGSLAIARDDRARSVAMGACMAAYQVAYFTAVSLTGITVAALIAICSAPLMIAALAGAFLGERPSPRVLVALVLGVSGTALLVLGPGSSVAASRSGLGGVVLALAAGFAYALYAVLTKACLRTSAPLPLTAVTFGLAAVLLVPALAWTDAPARQIALGWPWLLYLGAIATAAAYAMYTSGLRSVNASIAGIVTLVEPLTATLLGVIVFGERLGAAGVAGAALMVSALALLVTGRRGGDA
jgi:drug/metabolite transporter, DME family